MKKYLFFLLGNVFFLGHSLLKAQDRLVSGRVSDNYGNRLGGIFVHVKGTKKITQSNPIGEYAIFANSNDILVFSGANFVEHERKVGLNAKIIVELLYLKEADEFIIVHNTITKKESFFSILRNYLNSGTVAPTSTLQNYYNLLKNKLSFNRYFAIIDNDDFQQEYAKNIFYFSIINPLIEIEHNKIELKF